MYVHIKISDPYLNTIACAHAPVVIIVTLVDYDYETSANFLALIIRSC